MSTPIHQEVVLGATPARIYDALMSSAEHSTFTGGPAEISGEVGGAFSCHGGQVVGRNLELVPGKRIVQAWRLTNWDDGVYSVVRFELIPDGTSTKLILDHVGVPEAMIDGVASGWSTRYWVPLEAHLA
jgi:activator of HSP90 ATPase